MALKIQDKMLDMNTSIIFRDNIIIPDPQNITNQTEKRYKFRDSYTITIEGCQLNFIKEGTGIIDIKEDGDDLVTFLREIGNAVGTDNISMAYNVEYNNILCKYNTDICLQRISNGRKFNINGWRSNVGTIMRNVNVSVVIEEFVVIRGILQIFFKLNQIILANMNTFDINTYIKENYPPTITCVKSGLNDNINDYPTIKIDIVSEYNDFVVEDTEMDDGIPAEDLVMVEPDGCCHLCNEDTNSIIPHCQSYVCGDCYQDWQELEVKDCPGCFIMDDTLMNGEARKPPIT